MNIGSLLRAVRRRKIVVGLAATGVLAIGGVALAAVPSHGPDPAQVAELDSQRSAQAADRDLDRTLASASPSSSPSTGPSLSPSPSPSAAQPSPKATTAKAAPKATATRKTTTTATPASCRAYTGNRLIACKLLPSFGFAYAQMSSLDKLWTRESDWTTTAENSGSGAYGIPQSLPGSKMASAGSDWRTNPATQIKWGLGYIRSVYGSPSAAWAHSEATGWY
ncbi:aggregation-promoting factor C-terminal-like domain-containing protein [Hamadaea tsunoensis]|uniref:aggregation-promoting factor C-terminal-like domain-containing protein n=1 Tax=Hamadaea tsunoensis TaxID=53368 RepID=UPI00042293B8|nr:hypothetical protein [Hamadaea tsunoensis]